MLELFVIGFVAVVFTKASKNKRSSSLFWVILGILYYLIGRFLFAVILYIGCMFLLENETYNFSTIGFAISFSMFEIAGGVLLGLFSAYVLGEISGLNIKRVLNED